MSDALIRVRSRFMMGGAMKDRLARLDHQYLWHPFTQMREWLSEEPIVLTSGKGAEIWDAKGNRYLDANASIWTNLHGHNHPKINKAIKEQLSKVAHTSALGFANEPASLLGEKLVRAANPPSLFRENKRSPEQHSRAPLKLRKVFYSDDGSTAMEVALKLSYEHARRERGRRSPRFLSLDSAYHGDTVGAVSLGHVDLFHRAYSGLLFKSDRVMAPYCYRCRFNRARPERADARVYRKCHWECLDQVEKPLARQKKKGNPYAGMVVEPLMQGVAGMVPQPEGWLAGVADRVRGHGGQLIADEVMTGFGRSVSMFACHREGVQPDFLAVAKGMTGGYLPMAATMTTQEVFDAFLGRYEEFKTFFHGHSFTSNQLGSAAALASMDLLTDAEGKKRRRWLEKVFSEKLGELWDLPLVGDIRQVGLMAGVELVADWRTRQRFDVKRRVGKRVCDVMAEHGVLTRPIGDVVVLMPPYCMTEKQVDKMVGALRRGIESVMRS